ncbi:MAG: aminotransferase class V-fold PLP-dependent enzyme [Candidatus Latescibacteria bacterium]|jgi:selenocysteine lyase/cysteine desulfurase|nr:aminotransferase class V-fold PLP-dependent enzyme [Candidatus Latescibacterota bacterium]
MDIDGIREDFPALKTFVWFQNGGVSITPAPVADAHSRLMRELLDRGPMHIAYPDEEYPRREESKDKLARFFSVEPGDLALMRGVSEGFQTVLRGTEWRAGDRVLISEEEEAALLLPSLHLRDLYGVEVVKFPLADDPEGQRQAVADRMTDRTRLVAFSHVITDSGHRLPVEAICSLAREHGAMSFVDMAHSAGLYPIDLYALGCDFAGILSYKWMYAPYASGVLFTRKDRLVDIRVTYAGGRAEAWLDFRRDRYELKPTAERFEYGPWSWPLVHAWAESAHYLLEIGLESIWERTGSLTSRLKGKLLAIPGVSLITPEGHDRSAALVSFEVAGWDVEELRDRLRSGWNLVVKSFKTTRDGLRASVPFFLLEEEIDLLAEAVGSLAGERN